MEDVVTSLTRAEMRGSNLLPKKQMQTVRCLWGRLGEEREVSHRRNTCILQLAIGGKEFNERSELRKA